MSHGRILLFGDPGTGKSTIGNILKDPSDSVVNSGTKAVCLPAKEKHWIVCEIPACQSMDIRGQTKIIFMLAPRGGRLMTSDVKFVKNALKSVPEKIQYGVIVNFCNNNEVSWQHDFIQLLKAHLPLNPPMKVVFLPNELKNINQEQLIEFVQDMPINDTFLPDILTEREFMKKTTCLKISILMLILFLVVYNSKHS